jgi:hypothetical protein
MKKKWRCYFCDEVFTNKDKAAEHFGVFEACEADVPACKLMQHQEEFIKYVRGLEQEIRLYQDDNQPLQRAMFALNDEINSKVKEAEEKGYAKAVQDMMKQGYCVEPAKHQ